MNITVVGASGKIARHLHPILIEKGHHVRGIIRKKEQKSDLKKLGVEPVICDIEQEADISEAVGNVDAVLFAAGAGPGSGKERKKSVDRDGAIKLIRACAENEIQRYIMISAMGLDTPRGDEVFQAYQKAKADADEALLNSGLNYTIIKPGRLTNENGTGNIKVGNLDGGEIPREDVAAVVAESFEEEKTFYKSFDLLSGDTPIPDALQSL
ncbi:SDR family oxidoreductase [Rhodohalobacter sp. SW132]|uniref:SDR family oxidoreductase n=1 Tax=Rhodohalobacter sp. SW132 TaxID=2293433 RepID=UPI000E2215BC|nr:SDR family oxidoreductase [Rhodohalobacter sp. SW132]REL37708.1 SDR family oxidoreductase [Rhodohalobacter sp. SW132]